MHTYRYLSIALILTFSIPAHATKLNPVVALLMMVAPVQKTITHSPHTDSATRAAQLARTHRTQKSAPAITARSYAARSYAARRSVHQPASCGSKRG